MVKKSTLSNSNVMELPCRFGGVSFDARASVQVIFDKSQFRATKAEELFCGRRLDVKLKAAKSDEDAEQQHFEGMDCYSEVEGSADANRYQSAPDRWGTKLYFNMNDVNELDFLHLRKRKGMILIRGVAEIPEKEEADGPKDLPGQKTLEGHWRDESILKLSLGAGPEKTLTDAKLKTVGALCDFIKQNGDIKLVSGIGPAAAEKITKALEQFWLDHPEASDQADQSEDVEDESDDDDDEE